MRLIRLRNVRVALAGIIDRRRRSRRYKYPEKIWRVTWRQIRCIRIMCPSVYELNGLLSGRTTSRRFPEHLMVTIRMPTDTHTR